MDFHANKNYLFELICAKHNLREDTNTWELGNMVGDVKVELMSYQPVHRCLPKTFENIIASGFLRSKQFVQNLKEQPWSIVKRQIREDETLREIIHGGGEVGVGTGAFNIDIFFGALYDLADLLLDVGVKGNTKIYHCVGMYKLDQRLNPDERSIVEATDTAHAVVRSVFTGANNGAGEDLQWGAIWDRIQRIVFGYASQVLETEDFGLDNPNDEKLGTNNHIFAILGPHIGEDNYGEICIVLKQDIMYHPHFNMTPCAGTSFMTGNASILNTYHPRQSFHSEEQSVDAFHRSKLSCACKGWASVISAVYEHNMLKWASLPKPEHNEIMGNNLNQITFRKGLGMERKSLGEGTFGLMMQYQTEQCPNTHTLIECHLPEKVAIQQYVDRVVMSPETWESLSALCRQRVVEVFGHTIVMNDGFSLPPIEKKVLLADTVVREYFATVHQAARCGTGHCDRRGFHFFVTEIMGVYKSRKRSPPWNNIQPKNPMSRARISFRFRGDGHLVIGHTDSYKKRWVDDGEIFVGFGNLEKEKLKQMDIWDLDRTMGLRYASSSVAREWGDCTDNHIYSTRDEFIRRSSDEAGDNELKCWLCITTNNNPPLATSFEMEYFTLSKQNDQKYWEFDVDIKNIANGSLQLSVTDAWDGEGVVVLQKSFVRPEKRPLIMESISFGTRLHMIGEVKDLFVR